MKLHYIFSSNHLNSVRVMTVRSAVGQAARSGWTVAGSVASWSISVAGRALGGVVVVGSRGSSCTPLSGSRIVGDLGWSSAGIPLRSAGIGVGVLLFGSAWPVWRVQDYVVPGCLQKYTVYIWFPCPRFPRRLVPTRCPFVVLRLFPNDLSRVLSLIRSYY